MDVSTFVSFSCQEGESKLPLKLGWRAGGGGPNNTCRMATTAYTLKDVGHGSSTQYALVKAPGHCNGHPTFIKQCSNHSYLHSYSIAERIVLTFNADP